ncbi:TPA: hypothetical protein ACSK7M_002854 [Listeria innocua]|nr:hypothetical protein [Listeria innocua]HCJ4366002.1 hypothetical protein [Listeria innocua]
MDSIISNEIFQTIKSENVQEYLNDILILMNEVDNHNFKMKKHKDIWEVEINGEFFYEWLYSKTPAELVDLKTEFYRRMERVSDIDLDEYKSFESFLNESNPKYKDYDNQFLFIKKDNIKEIHVLSSLKRFYSLRRWYLEKCGNQKNFYNDLPLLFPNIYFHENVKSTLRTLNNDFNLILPEIVEHLSALELFHHLKLAKDGDSNIEKCQKFEKFSQISCSPESKRATAEKLSFKDDRGEKINCECHTKFKKIARDKTKQDRIYFSFGQKGYQEEAIIVYHIGKHI